MGKGKFSPGQAPSSEGGSLLRILVILRPVIRGFFFSVEREEENNS